MKKKVWIIVAACVAAVVIAAGCLVGLVARRGISLSEAVYVETLHGDMLLIDGSPISMSGKAGLFAGLTMGDRVRVAHGPIAESYPGQSKAYWCKKLADGTEEDIPVEVLQSLRDMGWLAPEIAGEDGSKTGGQESEPGLWVDPRPWYEDEVIALAKEQITWNYYAVTAEQDSETGEWTVTFWSKDRETFQVVVIDRYGGILRNETGTLYGCN